MIARFNKLYRYLPSTVLCGTFHDDGKTVWLRGVHRRWGNKANSKTLRRLRVQDVLHDDMGASYATSASVVNYVPVDEPLSHASDQPSRWQGPACTGSSRPIYPGPRAELRQRTVRAVRESGEHGGCHLLPDQISGPAGMVMCESQADQFARMVSGSSS